MDELHAQMVSAMKAKDKTRLSIIRQVMAEVKNIEVNERRDATEEDVTASIRRLIKQTSETLEMSEKAGNNQERTDTLREQVKILESLLPAQLAGEGARAADRAEDRRAWRHLQEGDGQGHGRAQQGHERQL